MKLTVYRFENDARRVFFKLAAIVMTLSTMTSVLPPIWRVMLMSAAGLPSPATMRTWSSVPVFTVAVADAQAVADDDLRDVVGRMRFVRGDDEILLVILRHAADLALTVVAD